MNVLGLGLGINKMVKTIVALVSRLWSTADFTWSNNNQTWS